MSANRDINKAQRAAYEDMIARYVSQPCYFCHKPMRSRGDVEAGVTVMRAGYLFIAHKECYSVGEA